MRTKYLQLAQALREELPRLTARGVYKLPSEAALMQQYAVSRQTVRRALAALSAEGLVETRQGSAARICRVPGKAAREIALLLPFADDYLYPALQHDLRAALAKHGYTLTLYETGGSVYQEREQLIVLLREPPAGILAQGCKTALPNPNTDLYEQLRLLGTPLVFLYSAYPALQSAVCVRQDDYNGGYQLAKHCIDLERTRIAGLFCRDDIQGHERYRGCISALRDAALLPPDERFFWISSNDQKQLASSTLPPWLSCFINNSLADSNAVVCDNDEIAYYLIKALLAAGRRVPEQIAVVSFDNSYYATLGAVGITSLGHVQETPAQCAARLIVKQLRGSRCTSQVLSWTLFERASSK